MSKLAELNYGTLDSVEYYLDATACDESELRAALLNLLRRVRTLEQQVQAMAARQVAP